MGGSGKAPAQVYRGRASERVHIWADGRRRWNHYDIVPEHNHRYTSGKSEPRDSEGVRGCALINECFVSTVTNRF